MLKASGADKFAGQFRNAASNIQGMTGHTEKASTSVKKFIGIAAGVAASVGVFRILRDSVGDAVSRFDTLKTFPRVMELLGNSTESSEAAIQKLSDGIDGLPTTLDGVASTTQRIAAMTGDLDGAVDITLALNNAFLASGASTGDASRGLDQYVQMLAKGEVDLQSWRTLQETMPVALNKTAEAFGYTGASAQNDLYDALKEGEITFADFNSQIINLSNETGGFADLAKEASKGIATSWQNIKTAIVKGMADMIGTIDVALESFGGISGVLDMVKEAARNAFLAINEALPSVIEAIGSFVQGIRDIWMWLGPLQPVIIAVAQALGIVVGALVGFSVAKSILMGVLGVVRALNLALLLNPWVLIATAAVAAVLLIIQYWDPISEFFVNLWNKIKIIFFAAYAYLDQITNGGFSAYLTIVSGYMQMIWSNIKLVWDFVKNTFTNVLAFLKALVNGDFQGMKDAINNQMTNAKNLLNGIWSNIKGFFSTYLSEIWSNVKQKFVEIALAVLTYMVQAKDNAVSKLSEMWSSFTSFLGDIWNTVVQKFSDIVSSISEKMNEALNFVIGIGEDIISFFSSIDLYESGKAIIQSAIDGLASMKSKIVGKVEEIVGAVRDFWPFSPAKTGPLSDIHKMDFAGPIGDSISKAKRPLQKDMAGLASAVNNEISAPTIGKMDIARQISDINRKTSAQMQSRVDSQFNVDNRPVIEVNNNWDGEKVRTSINVRNANDQRMRQGFSGK